MTLRAYFRVSQAKRGLEKNNLHNHSNQMIEIIEKLPFGKIHKYTPENE